MNQDRGSDEGLFQDVKGLRGRWCPGQSFGLEFEEVGERTGNGAIVLDEPSIEIGETQKALEFLDRRGYGPILDGGYLPLVHFDAILVDVVT